MTCKNCNGTHNAMYFSEQAWDHEERECHMCRGKPTSSDTEPTAAIERAVTSYKSMTPRQKRGMHDAQRRSWVIGNMMLDHPDMSREYAENIYDKVV